MITRFDSLTHALTEVDARARGYMGWRDEARDESRRRGRGSWDAGVSSPQALELARNGDASMVADMQSSVDKIATFESDLSVMRTVAGPSGGYVCIPAHLSGRPDPMRRRARSEASRHHVSIYVSIVCSAGIPADSMLKRGAAILGMIEVLRGMGVQCDVNLLVELHGATDGNQFMVIPIESRPLDLSVSGFAIAHPAFARNLIYPLGRAIDAFNGAWPNAWGTANYEAMVRETVGMSDSDLWIHAPHYSHDKVISDPHAWLAENVSQILNASREGES